MIVGANLDFTRTASRKITLETIRLQEPISRAEISRITGLTMPTISSFVAELTEKKIVLVKGRRQGQRGQPAIELELNPDGGFAIGLHLERIEFTGVLMNLAGEVKGFLSKKLTSLSPNVILPLMHEFVRDLLKNTEISPDRLWGVGLALPGPFLSLEKGIIEPPDMPYWKNISIKEELRKTLDMPIFIENDVTAAAIGEKFHGKEKDILNFFYFYIGTGLGGGIILNGTPYRGHRGNTALIDEMKTTIEGKTINFCETIGVKVLWEFLRSHEITFELNGDLQDLIELFQQKNPYLLEWLDRAALALVPVVHSIKAILNPQAIYFGGLLPSVISDYLIAQFKRNEVPLLFETPEMHRTKILKAGIGEKASALGAATLPFYEGFYSS